MKSKKLNIMKTRPDIGDEEIQKMMDFNSVLDMHRAAPKPAKPMRFIVPGIVAILIGAWLLWPKEQAHTKVVQPAIEKAAEQPKEIVEQPQTDKPVLTKKPVETKIAEPAPPVAETYTEAEPVNGYPDLYGYFQKELTYPVEALKDSIEGIVSVSFVIGKTGKPEQIKILNSPGIAFDNEAVRVISGMPEWKPASLNGKPVPARISMPLTFQINRTAKP